MKNFLLNLINNFFGKKSNAPQKNTMKKSRMTSSATLTLSSKLETTKERVQEDVRKIAKENADNIKNLLNYSKNGGTNFYFIKNAQKILNFIGETPGLIFPLKGLKALYLNFMLLKKFSFHTETLFVFDKEKSSAYDILYNFYKWYANKEGLPGFDTESLSKFKDINQNPVNDAYEKLNYNDILAIKEALAREKEAMEFVLGFMKEIEGSKKAFSIMKNKEGGANL